MGNQNGTINWGEIPNGKFILVQIQSRHKTGIEFKKACYNFLAARADLKDLERDNCQTGFVVYKKDGTLYLVLSSTSKKDNFDWRKVTENCCKANDIRVGDTAVLKELGLLKPKKEVKEDEVPGGEWLKSSRNASMKDGVLSAELQKKDGTWVEAVVKVQPNTEYKNDNGMFAIYLELPRGNWIEGARNYQLKDGVLVAELRDLEQKWVESRIKVKPGEEYINQDGKLRPASIRRPTVSEVITGAIGMTPVDPTKSFFKEKRDLAHDANELQEDLLAQQEKVRKLNEKLERRKTDRAKQQAE